MKQSFAIFGGSFDPPHNGHINTAISLQACFHFDKFLFVPCKQSVLKDTALANPEQRVAMLKLALPEHVHFTIDTRELRRDSPSYTIETLKSFREQLGWEITLTIIIGIDAYLQLPDWYEWSSLLEYGNIIVINRDSTIESSASPALFFDKACYVNDPEEFKNAVAGKVLFFDAGNYPVSSSDLRAKIKDGQDVSVYLPAAVLDYIKKEALYR